MTFPIALAEGNDFLRIVELNGDDVHGQSQNVRYERKFEMILDGGHHCHHYFRVVVTIDESPIDHCVKVISTLRALTLQLDRSFQAAFTAQVASFTPSLLRIEIEADNAAAIRRQIVFSLQTCDGGQ